MVLAGTQIEVAWGKINLIWDQDGISYLSLPGSEDAIPFLEESNAPPDLEKALKDYFQGKPVDFDFKTNLSGLTPFQQEVLEAAKTIPYGETRTYLWLAREIGAPRAARAVGGALGRNPISIIIP